jgi:hypothetical protein
VVHGENGLPSNYTLAKFDDTINLNYDIFNITLYKNLAPGHFEEIHGKEYGYYIDTPFKYDLDYYNFLELNDQGSHWRLIKYYGPLVAYTDTLDGDLKIIYKGASIRLVIDT